MQLIRNTEKKTQSVAQTQTLTFLMPMAGSGNMIASGSVSSLQQPSLMDHEESKNEPNLHNLSRQKWIHQMKCRREEAIVLNTERNLIKKALYENPEIFHKNANLRFQHDWIDMMPPDMDINNAMFDGASQQYLLSSGTGGVLSPQHAKQSRPRLSLPQSSPSSSRGRAQTHTYTVPSTSTSATGMTKEDVYTGVTTAALPEPVRRRSISGIIAGTTDIPTPVAHSFLQHTVGIEELRNHLNDHTTSASALTSAVLGEDMHGQYPSGDSLKYSTELLSKYTHPAKRVTSKHKKPYDQHIKTSNNTKPPNGNELTKKAGNHPDTSNAGSDSGDSGLHEHSSDETEHSSDEESEDNNTLIDCLFLVGPEEEELNQFVDSVLDEFLETNSNANTVQDNTSFAKANNTNISTESGKESRPRSTRNLMFTNPEQITKPLPAVLKKTSPSIAADMMFMTSDDPLVETEVLPKFCFPRGIETTVAILPTKVSLMSPTRRKPSPRYTNKQRILFQSKTSSGASNCNRFVFLLSNHTSNQFGICMTIPRIVTLERRNKSIKVKTCYCLTILTAYPFFSFFFQLLTEYVNMKGFCVDATSFVTKQAAGDLLQYELRQLESFAMKLIRHAIPHPGQSLLFSFTMNMIRQEILIKRLLIGNRVEENCVGTLLWALPILLKNFELDLILEVIGCLLTEMKVVVRCKNLEILSACILSFVYLLRPLKWVCPTIVILPASMHDFLDSPVPVILGVESTPQSFVMTNGLIVVDPEQKVIHWHPSDLVTKKALTLPKVNRLQQQLKPLMDNILKLTKKLKKKKTLAISTNELSSNSTTSRPPSHDKSNANQTQTRADENSTNSDSDDATSTDPPTTPDNKHPRPVSMPAPKTNNIFGNVTVNDDDYVQSPLLASAIATFSTTVSLHMQKVVYTAIHMKWKLHQLKQQQQIDLANVPREPTQSVSSKHNIASDESITSDASTIFSNDNSGSHNYGSAAFNHAPPPPTGADWFIQQELGSGGVTFMQSFIQSQMFCNYIQQEEEEKEKRAQVQKKIQAKACKDHTKKRHESGDVEECSLGDSVVDDDDISVMKTEGVDDVDDTDLHSLEFKVNLSPPPPLERKDSVRPLHSTRSNHPRATPRLDQNTLPLLPDDADTYAHLMHNPLNSPRKDPLISLFSVILTGSYPMSQHQLDELLSKYERVYAKVNEEEIISNEVRPESETVMVTSTDTDTDASAHTNRYPVYVEDTEPLEVGLLCNGRCGGLANTSSCTNICLDMWEQRAQQLRRQASVVDIIRRRGSTMTPGTKKPKTPTGSNSQHPPPHAHPPSGVSGKVHLSSGNLTGLDLYRNTLPKRHKRETIGQYTHRTALITGRSEGAILAELNFVSDDGVAPQATSSSAGNVHASASTQNQQGLSQAQPHHTHGTPRELTHSHSHTSMLISSASSSSLLSTHSHLLPRHLQLKEVSTDFHSHSIDNPHDSQPSAKNHMSPAVLAIARQRKRKKYMKQQLFQHQHWLAQQDTIRKAVVLIQKECRGYIVRNNINIIISSLLQRKQRVINQRRDSVSTIEGSDSVCDEEYGHGYSEDMSQDEENPDRGTNNPQGSDSFTPTAHCKDTSEHEVVMEKEEVQILCTEIVMILKISYINQIINILQMIW
mgnify:CR=1 FL=1